MIKPILNGPVSSDILKQAVLKITAALEVEENALSDILRFERDIIQKAKIDSANLEEYVAINESINGIMANIIEVQNTAQMKLQLIEGLFQTLENPIRINIQQQEEAE